MKKFILTIALVATLGSTIVSCSTDDSPITDASSNELSQPGNGNIAIPKPTTPKP
ncbi:hypothetical protein [uncultured Flavobacterium sp.]|uniref:hypothetical protein n=1 Tax=uncultured Flavobacterium sp. TaxID=165435 RepID=UPI0025EC4F26|nr:hypothetical protein [uncultured Flavobacterium sp.]